jgi:hypothetical protein
VRQRGRVEARSRLGSGFDRRCLDARSLRPFLPDRLVEPLGLGFRPDAKLVLQGIAAQLVLLQRQRRLALLGVNPHERTVRGLL